MTGTGLSRPTLYIYEDNFGVKGEYLFSDRYRQEESSENFRRLSERGTTGMGSE